MDVLRPGLQDSLSALIASGVVQGAVLEIDRFWLEPRVWKSFRDPLPEFWLARTGLYDSPFPGDLNYKPDNWSDHCKSKGYSSESSPFVIRVILYPSASSATNPNLYPTLFQEYSIV